VAKICAALATYTAKIQDSYNELM